MHFNETTIFKNFKKSRLEFYWVLEDIYDNVCRNYGWQNNNWYPSAKYETYTTDKIDSNESWIHTKEFQDSWAILRKMKDEEDLRQVLKRYENDKTKLLKIVGEEWKEVILGLKD
jgi:putative heme degradation protein